MFSSSHYKQIHPTVDSQFILPIQPIEITSSLNSSPSNVLTDFSRYLKKQQPSFHSISNSPQRNSKKKTKILSQNPNVSSNISSVNQNTSQSDQIDPIFTSLKDLKIVTKHLTSKRSAIRKFGLNLRPLCTVESHQKQEVSLICVDPSCRTTNKFSCEKCQFDGNHANHEMVDLEEFTASMDEQYKKFDEMSRLFLNQCVLLEQPPFLAQIFKELNNFKKHIYKQIENTKTEMATQYRYHINNEVIHFREEANKNQKILELYSDLLSKPVFSYTDYEIETSIEMFLNTNQLQCSSSMLNSSKFSNNTKEMNNFKQTLNQENKDQKILNNSIKNIQLIYSKLEKMFNLGFLSFKDNLFFDIEQSFQEFMLPKINQIQQIILNQKQSFKSQHSLKSQRIDLLVSELEQQVKDKSKLAKQLREYQKQPEQIASNILKASTKFPYFAYFDSCCPHIIESNANTVPIFACCEQAYRCIQCHNACSTHPAPSGTNVSERYCTNCFEIFTVNYPLSSPVICLECQDIPK